MCVHLTCSHNLPSCQVRIQKTVPKNGINLECGDVSAHVAERTVSPQWNRDTISDLLTVELSERFSFEICLMLRRRGFGFELLSGRSELDWHE